MTGLTRYLYLQACNNAWSNFRLLRACQELSDQDFAARRTSSFPSLRATLNHNLAVDRYYLDALERSVRGHRSELDLEVYFGRAAKHSTCDSLWRAQRGVDLRLVEFCRELCEDQLSAKAAIVRETSVVHEPVWRVLAHLFQHQIHHRGQAHSMLSGTSITPPQLDEYYLWNDAPLRAVDLVELGLDDASPFPPEHDSDDTR